MLLLPSGGREHKSGQCACCELTLHPDHQRWVSSKWLALARLQAGGRLQSCEGSTSASPVMQGALDVQVEEVSGKNVVCSAQNDALLEGLLTLIHQERESEFGMSSIQVRLACAGSAPRDCICSGGA